MIEVMCARCGETPAERGIVCDDCRQRDREQPAPVPVTPPAVWFQFVRVGDDETRIRRWQTKAFAGGTHYAPAADALSVEDALWWVYGADSLSELQRLAEAIRDRVAGVSKELEGATVS